MHIFSVTSQSGERLVLNLPTTTLSAQTGRGVASTTKPGLTIYVSGAGDEIDLFLENADVMLVMGKDTVKMKSDANGEVHQTHVS